MNWRQLFVFIFAFLIIAIPLLAPGFFIVFGIIAWSITYAVIYFMSIGHDLSNTIPWMVVKDDEYWTYLILLGLFGLIRGPIGSVALLVTWGPYFLLPAFLLNLNLATVHQYGWVGYVMENYQEEQCKTDKTSPPNRNGQYDVYCVRLPKYNKDLPGFITDDWDNYIRQL